MLERLRSVPGVVEDHAFRPGIEFCAVSVPEVDEGSVPLAHNGNYLLAADLQLHNRQQLTSALCNGDLPPSPSDADLVLAAYRTWGTNCAQHLDGEFAFAIWDADKAGLFACRDAMGSRSLFYRYTSDQIEIASDLFPWGLPPSIEGFHEPFFREFYAHNGCTDTPLTPYRHLLRLAGAHWLWADSRGIKTRAYWELPTNAGQIRYGNLQSYAEHLDVLLREAVRCRLSDRAPNAVALSGGLDSATVFAYARELDRRGDCGPVIPVSLCFDQHRASDERVYTDQILAQFGVEPNYISGDECWAFKGFPADVPWHDEPKVGTATISFPRALARGARAAGARILLTGVGGDQALTGTPLSISDQLRDGRAVAAVSSAWRYSCEARLPFLPVLWSYGIAPLLRRSGTPAVP